MCGLMRKNQVRRSAPPNFKLNALTDSRAHSPPYLVRTEGQNMDERLDEAKKDFEVGDYRRALALLHPLRKRKLSPAQEIRLFWLLGCCYRSLENFDAALPTVERQIVLYQTHQNRSLGHAAALYDLCMVRVGLKMFPEARKAITEALAVLGELGLQASESEQYGGMLCALATVDRLEQHFDEALIIYARAKSVLLRHKTGSMYGLLLSEMAICHRALDQFSEANTCYKQDVEHSLAIYGDAHPQYATALGNHGRMFLELKQYEEAASRFAESLAIHQKLCGNRHPGTVQVAGDLRFARELAKRTDRHLISADHAFRMCNGCATIKGSDDAGFCMPMCTGCARVWYCDTKCQLQHWPTHKLTCKVCLHCETLLTKKANRCSRCKTAKYCNVECQKEDWSEHKHECVKAFI